MYGKLLPQRRKYRSTVLEFRQHRTAQPRQSRGKADIQELCGPGIMIGNLLEQINDYSYSKIEDTVVEEEDDIIYVTTEYKEHLI